MLLNKSSCNFPIMMFPRLEDVDNNDVLICKIICKKVRILIKEMSVRRECKISKVEIEVIKTESCK